MSNHWKGNGISIRPYPKNSMLLHTTQNPQTTKAPSQETNCQWLQLSNWQNIRICRPFYLTICPVCKVLHKRYHWLPSQNQPGPTTAWQCPSSNSRRHLSVLKHPHSWSHASDQNNPRQVLLFRLLSFQYQSTPFAELCTQMQQFWVQWTALSTNTQSNHGYQVSSQHS